MNPGNIDFDDIGRVAGNADWVPARMMMSQRAGRLLWIKWQDLGFHPFFNHAVNRALTANVATCTTPLEAVLEAGKRRAAGIAPSGFIQHMSRCGSTTVANALAGLDQTRVLSEPQPLTDLLTPYSGKQWPIAAAEFEARRDALLRAMAQCYAGPAGTRTFFKFTSWNSLHIDVVSRLWPTVPWIYMCRDPLVVLVSNLEKRPGWMKFKRDPELARWFMGWENADADLSGDEAYCARVLGAFCDAAATSMNACGTLVRYEDLSPALIETIAMRFGLSISAAERQRIAESMRFYSKGANRSTPFSDDTATRLVDATPAMRQAVQTWTAHPYSRLLGTANTATAAICG